MNFPSQNLSKTLFIINLVMSEKQTGFFSFVAKSTYVFVLVVASIIISAVALFVTIKKTDDIVNQNYTFDVSGSATKRVNLDTARISLGVILKDQTPTEVQKRASERYSKAIEAIKAVGIPQEDIQTQAYNVRSVTNPDTREVEGYEINLSLDVIIRDTKPESEIVTKVINAASESGFNNINDLYFYLDDIVAFQDELKDEAINDAKERAKQQADAAGIKLGKILNMYSYDDRPYYDTGFAYSEMKANAVDYEEASLPAIEFQPGQTEVVSNVTLVYEIL